MCLRKFDTIHRQLIYLAFYVVMYSMDQNIEFTAIKKDLLMIAAVIIIFAVILFGLDMLQGKNQFVTKSATKISSVLLK